MNWYTYLEEYTNTDGTHKAFPNWKQSGIWEFTRTDGLATAHKMESPCPFWTDVNIPLNSELPESMRTKSDPLYPKEAFKNPSPKAQCNPQTALHN
jgi:hypothetical protein